MRNHILFILLQLFQLVLINSHIDVKIPKEIDYFAYYIHSKNIMVCSYSKFTSESVFLNQFENGDNGFTCLFKLNKFMKNEGEIFGINFHISNVGNNEQKYDLKRQVDFSLGNDLILPNLQVGRENYNFDKNLKFKYENSKIFYAKDDGKFTEINDGIFMKNYLKINFNFHIDKNLLNIILLEKETAFKSSEDCDPACEYGVCNDADCLCQIGYMGINCSISKINIL